MPIPGLEDLAVDAEDQDDDREIVVDPLRGDGAAGGGAPGIELPTVEDITIDPPPEPEIVAGGPDRSFTRYRDPQTGREWTVGRDPGDASFAGVDYNPEALAHGAGQALTLGTSDEAAADFRSASPIDLGLELGMAAMSPNPAGLAALRAIRGEDPERAMRYQQELARARGTGDELAEEHPGSYWTGQAAGTLPLVLAGPGMTGRGAPAAGAIGEEVAEGLIGRVAGPVGSAIGRFMGPVSEWGAYAARSPNPLTALAGRTATLAGESAQQLPARAIQGAIEGSGYGAASGAGYSDAESLDDLGGDIAGGAAAGAGVGAAGQVLRSLAAPAALTGGIVSGLHLAEDIFDAEEDAPGVLAGEAFGTALGMLGGGQMGYRGAGALAQGLSRSRIPSWLSEQAQAGGGALMDTLGLGAANVIPASVARAGEESRPRREYDLVSPQLIDPDEVPRGPEPDFMMPQPAPGRYDQVSPLLIDPDEVPRGPEPGFTLPAPQPVDERNVVESPPISITPGDRGLVRAGPYSSMNPARPDIEFGEAEIELPSMDVALRPLIEAAPTHIRPTGREPRFAGMGPAEIELPAMDVTPRPMRVEMGDAQIEPPGVEVEFGEAVMEPTPAATQRRIESALQRDPEALGPWAMKFAKARDRDPERGIPVLIEKLSQSDPAFRNWLAQEQGR